MGWMMVWLWVCSAAGLGIAVLLAVFQLRFLRQGIAMNPSRFRTQLAFAAAMGACAAANITLGLILDWHPLLVAVWFGTALEAALVAWMTLRSINAVRLVERARLELAVQRTLPGKRVTE